MWDRMISQPSQATRDWGIVTKRVSPMVNSTGVAFPNKSLQTSKFVPSDESSFLALYWEYDVHISSYFNKNYAYRLSLTWIYMKMYFNLWNWLMIADTSNNRTSHQLMSIKRSTEWARKPHIIEQNSYINDSLTFSISYSFISGYHKRFRFFPYIYFSLDQIDRIWF